MTTKDYKNYNVAILAFGQFGQASEISFRSLIKLNPKFTCVLGDKIGITSVKYAAKKFGIKNICIHKANISDLTNLINTKADLGSTQNSLQNKVNTQEFESLKLLVDRINKEILNKIDFNKFDAYMLDSILVIDELQKELALKSNLKETLSLLNKKADIEKVNDALIQVTEDLDQKCSIQQVSYL